MVSLSVVPRKAVAEVSKLGIANESLVCWESQMAERLHSLCFRDWLQWLQRSPPPTIAKF